MTTTSLSNFINNSEGIISNVLLNEEITKITTEEGDVVIITESQYEAFIDALVRTETANKWKSRRIFLLLIINYKIILKPTKATYIVAFIGFSFSI